MFFAVFFGGGRTPSDLADELLCRVGHEDTVAPGGAAGVHVLSGFSVLFTVGVAEKKARMSDKLPGSVVHCRDFDLIYCPTWAEILCPLPEQHHQRRRLLYRISKAVKLKTIIGFGTCDTAGISRGHMARVQNKICYLMTRPPRGFF